MIVCECRFINNFLDKEKKRRIKREKVLNIKMCSGCVCVSFCVCVCGCVCVWVCPCASASASVGASVLR